MKIGAILLAAGASTRMGFPKQLLAFEGTTLIHRAASTLVATVCQPIVVVLGANRNRIALELSNLPVAPAFNEDWEKGMASSLRAGIAEVLRIDPETNAILITLCDQPRVTANDLAALIDCFRRAGKPIAAALYGGTLGVPAIFSKDVYPELLALEGEAGARKVIAANPNSVAPFPLPSALLDIDTNEDYETFRKA